MAKKPAKQTKTTETNETTAPIKASKPRTKQVAQRQSDGAIVVMAPGEVVRNAPTDKPFDTVDQLRKAVRDTTRQTLSALIGKPVAAVSAALDSMVKTKEIVSFNIVAPGQGFDGDFQAGRVQLLEVGGMLKDFQVG